uniref:Uncharacterized protein n=1 Tax=Aegilops tauschii subsp. strangulata TaxID=200361 RepID=A0A453F0W6_AEGTS
RRELYDAGMYDPLDDDQEEVEGFHDFLQEMLSLMATVGRERSPCIPWANSNPCLTG